MPPDFQTSKTLGQLMLDVAGEVHLAAYTAAGVATLPANPETLRQLRAAVNEGLRYFVSVNPKWTRLREGVLLTFFPNGDGPLNIDRDPARYALPPYVRSRPLRAWTYTDGISSQRTVADASWDVVRQHMAAVTRTSGTPLLAACKPIGARQSHGDTGGWEAIFYPAPSSPFTVEAPFRVATPDMQDLDERHPFGEDHDLAILKCAVEALRRRDDADPEGWQRAVQDRDRQLEFSIALDRQLGERYLGRVGDPSVHAQERMNPRAGQYRALAYNGQPLA
ncbi:MAG: hypothetical protein KIS87_08840 [Phycisphaeraceae bacterium]|nr:hypothetical protein [Phycisphaeraceae bacterium]